MSFWIINGICVHSNSPVSVTLFPLDWVGPVQNANTHIAVLKTKWITTSLN